MSLSHTPRDVITDAEYVLSQEIMSALGIIIGVCGVLGNLVNVVIFTAMGVKDGVTISFLFLSFSDLLYIIVLLALQFVTAAWILDIKPNYSIFFEVDLYGIVILLGNIGNLIYTNLALITSFLALVRCLCVAKPLYFRNTFTRERSLWIMLGFSVMSVFGYLPVLASMGMEWRLDEATNTTRLKLWISPHRELIKKIIWGMKDTGLFPVTQVLVCICFSVMVYHLRQVSKFRRSFIPVPMLYVENYQEQSLRLKNFKEDHASKAPRHVQKEPAVPFQVSGEQTKLHAVHPVGLGQNELHVRPTCSLAMRQKETSFVCPIGPGQNESHVIYSVPIANSGPNVPSSVPRGQNESYLTNLVATGQKVLHVTHSVAIGHGEPRVTDPVALGHKGHYVACPVAIGHKEHHLARPVAVGHKEHHIARPAAIGLKELHAVRQVALISLIYIITNTTAIIITIGGLVEPGFSFVGPYKNIYDLLFTLLETLQMINSSGSFFIYYNYNSKFKSLCSFYSSSS